PAQRDEVGFLLGADREGLRESLRLHLKGLPPPIKLSAPAKRARPTNGTIITLIAVFCATVAVPYIARDKLTDAWARGFLGTTPFIWIVAATFVVWPQWRKLNRQAKDNLYLAVLIGFVGQLAAIVAYLWVL